MLVSLGIILLFGSEWIKFPGAGALAVLTTAFVSGHGWFVEGKVLFQYQCLPLIKPYQVGKLAAMNSSKCLSGTGGETCG